MTRRLAPLVPSMLAADQEALYRTLVEGPRGIAIVQPDGTLFAPFDAMLRSPVVGDRLQSLGLAVQAADALPPAVREAVVLAVAGRRGAEGEWRVHATRAIAAGLSPDALERLREGAIPADVTDDVRVAVGLANTQIDHRSPTDEDYAEGIVVLGERKMFEVAALVGYYDALCGVIAVFRLDDAAPESSEGS